MVYEASFLIEEEPLCIAPASFSPVRVHLLLFSAVEAEFLVGIRIRWMELTEWVSDPYLVTYAETSAPTPIGRDLSMSPKTTTGLSRLSAWASPYLLDFTVFLYLFLL